MDISFLVKGLIIGLAIAVPVGPISILCINRALVKGFWSGFVSGVGSAVADSVYAYIGIFGITFISSILVNQQLWLRLIGGLFLCYLGVKTFLNKTTVQLSKTTSLHLVSDWEKDLTEDFLSTFFLAMTNPMTFLPFAAIFVSSLSENVSPDEVDKWVFVLGVFISAAIWGSLLSSIASWLRIRFNFHSLRWVNRVSGVTIIAFAWYILWNLSIDSSYLGQ